VKRPLDLAVGLTIVPIAVPIILVAWLAVRLTSRGPGFYTQTRLGQFGRPYRILKLRTMYHRCEATSGARWSTRGDPRVTPVGRVLRKLHIDELPQLWNVLRGDMSLVGPRPERPEFVGPLSEAIPGYADRMRVRPGVTGLAQIQHPADDGLDSVRVKLVYDRHYIERRGPGLDARIFLGTLLYAAQLPFPVVRTLARLPRPADPVAGGERSAPETVADLNLEPPAPK
jgi:lipopolysaccharide/colanic/teichoic acid biosynthesis glycosyltransferase